MNEDSNVYRIGMGEEKITKQMSTCSLYQEGNTILVKDPPDEGIVDIGVTKYRSYTRT
jgi:hypothetical protein